MVRSERYLVEGHHASLDQLRRDDRHSGASDDRRFMGVSITGMWIATVAHVWPSIHSISSFEVIAISGMPELLGPDHYGSWRTEP